MENTYVSTGQAATNCYSVLYARNAFGTGAINIYGKDVSILTAKNASNSEYGYGNAISGNYAGQNTVEATGKLIVHGLIEGYNKYENEKNNGESSMIFNITGGDNSELIGGINAANNSKIYTVLGDNSAVSGDLVATASSTEPNGVITLTAGKKSQFYGNITARTGGNISLNVGEGSTLNLGAVTVDAGTLKQTGGTATFDSMTVTNGGYGEVAGNTRTVKGTVDGQVWGGGTANGTNSKAIVSGDVELTVTGTIGNDLQGGGHALYGLSLIHI